MKKFLVVSAIAALGFNSVGFAGGLPEEMPAAPTAVSTADTGVYVGLDGGWGFTNYQNNAAIHRSVSKDNGAVGRVHVGYDINRYFAAETGYSYFFNKVNLANQAGVDTRTDIKTQIIDVYFKGKLPVIENLDLFAKLGAGWIFAQWDSLQNGRNGSNSTKTNNINVAFGAGMDYYITPNIIADAQWLRVAGCEAGEGRNYIPNTDAFMVGVRYRFDM